MKLYKFRSIAGIAFRYTQDIFVNKRLYLPQAKMLNDPNEGIALVDIQNEYRAWGNQLSECDRQNKIRLCAFTGSYRNSVIWSHYADEHRGICIEFETDEIEIKEGVLRKVNYSNSIPILKHNSGADIKEAFLNKTSEWVYEEEWRYITEHPSNFLMFSDRAIIRVLLGSRFSDSDLNWVKFWIKNYNSTSRSIPIVKMKFASVDYSLYEENEMVGKVARIG